jgi:hypothetical protein
MDKERGRLREKELAKKVAAAGAAGAAAVGRRCGALLARAEIPEKNG